MFVFSMLLNQIQAYIYIYRERERAKEGDSRYKGQDLLDTGSDKLMVDNRRLLEASKTST